MQGPISGRDTRPRIPVMALGVADLERPIAFYRNGLGLPNQGIIGQEFKHGAVVFFDLAGGLKLAHWAQVYLAHDTGVPMRPVSPTAFSTGQNAGRLDEGDQGMAVVSRWSNSHMTRSTAAIRASFASLMAAYGKAS